MREADNIRAVDGLDIDYIGFIFYPKSPRYVSPDAPDAKQTRAVIRACRKRTVGVFVNVPFDEILQTADNYRLDAIQLHGDEPDELIGKLKSQGFEVFRAKGIDSSIKSIAGSIKTFATDIKNIPDYHLFDTKSASYGGTGKRFDWQILANYQENIPFFLSGGIKPDSVEDLKALQHPMLVGIDLNSGFETAPAVKDVALLKAFIEAIRAL